jgi:hypothetical protein
MFCLAICGSPRDIMTYHAFCVTCDGQECVTLAKLRSAIFWNFTQRRVVTPYGRLGKPITPIFKG